MSEAQPPWIAVIVPVGASDFNLQVTVRESGVTYLEILRALNTLAVEVVGKVAEATSVPPLPTMEEAVLAARTEYVRANFPATSFWSCDAPECDPNSGMWLSSTAEEDPEFNAFIRARHYLPRARFKPEDVTRACAREMGSVHPNEAPEVIQAWFEYLRQNQTVKDTETPTGAS